jgi:hypothetical protein
MPLQELKKTLSYRFSEFVYCCLVVIALRKLLAADKKH